MFPYRNLSHLRASLGSRNCYAFIWQGKPTFCFAKTLDSELQRTPIHNSTPTREMRFFFSSNRIKECCLFIIDLPQVCSSRFQGVLNRIPASGDEKTDRPFARVQILHEAAPGCRDRAYGCQRFCHEMMRVTNTQVYRSSCCTRGLFDDPCSGCTL